MSWLARVRNVFRPDGVRGRIDRELAFHLAERIDELRAAGLSADEARRRAYQQLGRPLLHADRTQDADVMIWLDALRRDLLFGCRTLLRSPGFTATAILTLGLGIGANTAVFSAVNAVLLRPLPFPDADRLVTIRQDLPRSADVRVAPVRLEDWNREVAGFDAISGYFLENASETSGDLPEQVRRAFVAPRFFAMWGVAPAMGRTFTAADHVPGAAPAVVISDRYWRRHFNARPDVLGATVRIGRASLPVVGVMPRSFRFVDRTVDLYAPVTFEPFVAQRRHTWYQAVGRVSPGVSIDRAAIALGAVQSRLGARFPETDADVRVVLTPLKVVAIGNITGSLWLLFGAVSLLLLIAATNIAALLLARAARRRHEFALRISLGASRGRVAAQMLTETGILAAAGCMLGLVIAAVAVAALRTRASTLPRMDEIALDWRIFAYALVAGSAVTLACGLLPALRVARGAGLPLGATERAQIGSNHAVQWVLVGAQVALAVTLLTGAGLLVRSIRELARVEAGFEPARVITFRVSGTWAETGNYTALMQRIETTLDRLRTLPGVTAAATGMQIPGVEAPIEESVDAVQGGSGTARPFVVDGRIVSRDYFVALQIPLLEGETCPPGASLPVTGVPAGAPAAALVNRAFSRSYLGGRSPVGLHLVSGQSSKRIVGVVGDARERGLERPPVPTIYSCMSTPNPTPYFFVRTNGDPALLTQPVRAALKELDPLRSVFDVAVLEERIGDQQIETRLRTTLLSAFAVAALALTSVGLYGTLAYVVGLRRREAGLRLALGAMRRDIVRHFIAHGLRVAGIAGLCGLVLAVASARLLSGMLYGVSPMDPLTLAAVAALVLVVATAATVLPSLRAARVEPAEVLRES